MHHGLAQVTVPIERPVLEPIESSTCSENPSIYTADLVDEKVFAALQTLELASTFTPFYYSLGASEHTEVSVANAEVFGSVLLHGNRMDLPVA